MRRFRVLLIPVCFSGALAGCRSVEDRTPTLPTRAGPRIESLWDAHGGYRTWKRYRAMTFNYRAEFAGGPSFSRRLTVLFDRPWTVWVGDGPSDGPHGRTVWSAVAVGGGEARPVKASWRPAGVGTPTPEAVDFALLSARNLLRFPFGMADEGWSVRVLVSAGDDDEALPEELEASPRRRPYLLGPYLLKWEGNAPGAAPKGPLERVLYASCHPGLARGVYEVRFRDYQRIQGILVAAEREHVQRWPRPEREIPDPLVLAPRLPPADPSPVFREILTDIRFLGAEDLLQFVGIPVR